MTQNFLLHAHLFRHPDSDVRLLYIVHEQYSYFFQCQASQLCYFALCNSLWYCDDDESACWYLFLSIYLQVFMHLCFASALPACFVLSHKMD